MQGNSVSQSKFEEFMRLAYIDNRSQSLDQFHYFLNPSIIPPDIDISAEVLPYAIFKKFRGEDLENY